MDTRRDPRALSWMARGFPVVPRQTIVSTANQTKREDLRPGHHHESEKYDLPLQNSEEMIVWGVEEGRYTAVSKHTRI